MRTITTAVLVAGLSAFSLSGCSSESSDASDSFLTTTSAGMTTTGSAGMTTTGSAGMTTTGSAGMTTTGSADVTTTGSAGVITTGSVAGSTTLSPSTGPTTGPTSEPTGRCTGKKMGTYTWSQDFWRKGDTSLVDFLGSDMGHDWACGDLYVSLADYSNAHKIADQAKLVAWAKELRRVTGNEGILWMTYGDVVSKRGQLMVDFVQTFKHFLLDSVSASDMAAIGPIGISFDVEHIAAGYYKEALIDAQQMKKDVSAAQGYPDGSVFVQSTIEGQKNSEETEYVMRYADSALMMLYRNAIGGSYADDLLFRMEWMLTEQCSVCLQPGWEDLKAKITIMGEASCEMGAGCKKVSFCAVDSANYPSKDGGIQYAWDTFQTLQHDMLSTNMVTQAQFDHLFAKDDTLFTLHNWDWSRCYYGDSFSQEMGYSNCQEYHTLSADCKVQ